MATTAPAPPALAAIDLKAKANEILNRWPAVGLAVGVVRSGGLDSFQGAGLADVASHTPVTQDTIFRIASVTKPFTAIALLQLWERGLINLDAPANDYLRGFKLVPAKTWFRAPTVRHLLTHTAGIREALTLADAFRWRDMGEISRGGRLPLSAAERYEDGLRFDADPGTRFMYTNHGFAALGQIIEDVSGESLDRYFKKHIFEPLGMSDTSLVRSDLRSSRFATAYELRSRGVQAVGDYEVVTLAGGGINSTPKDMARFVAALLGDRAGGQGSILDPETLHMMFQPHYRPDPRIPGIGLGVFLADAGGHLAVEHDGILPGFDAAILLAPSDGVGVMIFANGAKRGMHWPLPEADAILRTLIGVPKNAIRTDVSHHPELWSELCGWYHFSAALTDPGKLALGPGVEVYVHRGQLMIRALSLIPALNRGFVLYPDDDRDQYVFRIVLPWFGIGTGRVVFGRQPGIGVTAIHTDFGPLSFEKRPDATNPRRWIAPALGAVAAAGALTALRRHGRKEHVR